MDHSLAFSSSRAPTFPPASSSRARINVPCPRTGDPSPARGHLAFPPAAPSSMLAPEKTPPGADKRRVRVFVGPKDIRRLERGVSAFNQALAQASEQRSPGSLPGSPLQVRLTTKVPAAPMKKTTHCVLQRRVGRKVARLTDRIG